jgi:hypothetical protein
MTGTCTVGGAAWASACGSSGGEAGGRFGWLESVVMVSPQVSLPNSRIDRYRRVLQLENVSS